MQAVERMKTPASFLLDTFFPQVPAVATSKKIAVETRKRGRTLAPFVSRGASGVNVKRAGSKIALYEAPMMGPRTVIDPEQLDQRAFAENIVSTMTPAQRAAQMQAEDLSYLQGTIINRKNKMAADLLTTGKCKIEGYADDGETVQVVVKSFNDAEVTIDYNHPMAGRTLMFSVAILSLRDATEEEIQTGVVGGMAAMGGGCCGGGGHSHSHGGGSCGTEDKGHGHSHGGCGCH